MIVFKIGYSIQPNGGSMTSYNGDLVKLDLDTYANGFTFEQIFDIAEIQKLQDSFSAATGVASIITDSYGNPITEPSNFSSLCSNVIRKTDIGLYNCKLSDSKLGELNAEGPKMQPCLSCGLMDGGTSIVVDGKHIANWLIGQVLTEDISEEKIISYADQIGVDQEVFSRELQLVPRMSSKRFGDICNYLFANAQMLSKYAYKAKALTIEVQTRKNTEKNLNEAYEQIEASYEELIMIEEELRKQTETHKALFKNSPYGIVQFDANHHAVDVNDTFCSLFGYEAQEAIGVEVDTLISRNENRQEVSVYSKTLLSGESVSMKGIRTGKNNRDIMTSIVGVPVIFEDKVIGGFAVYADLTEEEQIKQDLIRAKDQAELAHQIKSDFLANMSHEIRTPMNGLIGMIQLLQLTPLDQDQKEYLELSRASSESLLSVVNGILDYTNIESGRIDIQAVEIDIRKMINDIKSLFITAAVNKGLKINCSVDDAIPNRVIGDEFRIRQVLSNLVGNAVKFTHKGEVKIAVQQIDTDENNMHILKFCVADTGIGIECDKHDLVFERFSQADNSSTRQYGGTGLGLAISKGVVGHLGGDIWLESQKAIGSKFYFTCPIGVKSERQKMTPFDQYDLQGLSLRSQGKPLRILLAEDDKITQTVISKLFGKHGWELTTVDNGIQALDAYKENRFDLIVMDCQMPELNGFDTAKKIRSMETGSNKIPIIAMTAGALDGDQEKCFEAGMTEYFSKPIAFKTFIQCIASYEHEITRDGE